MKKAGFGESIGVLIVILTFIILSAGIIAPALAEETTQKQAATPDLGQLKFLLGEWIGDGGGGPGQGSGSFTFGYDLQNAVIIRKNYAEYPATAEKPAFRHDDLMIIYQTSGDTLRAVYFDSEKHIINYTVDVAGDGKSAIFTSAPDDKSPRYRLTYVLTDENNVSINFDIAPPGQPEAFSSYIKATAHRK